MGRRGALVLGLAALTIGAAQGSQSPTHLEIDKGVATANAHIEQCQRYPEGVRDLDRNSCITYCGYVAGKAANLKQAPGNHNLRQFQQALNWCESKFEMAQSRMGSPATATAMAALGRRGLDAVDRDAKERRETCATTYGGETAERCIAACDTAITAVLDVLEGRPTQLATADGVRQSSRDCTSAWKAAGDVYARQLAAAGPSRSEGQAAETCDRRLTGKLCIKAEARLAKSTQALLGNLGAGQFTEDLIRQADRQELADSDASGVIRPSGSSDIHACNGSKRTARVASLRWSCLPSAVLREENYQCDLNFSGWAEFAPEECKPLRFSGDTLMLAIYRQDEAGQWEPSIYSDEDGRVDFDSAVGQPAGTMRFMLERVCGRRDENFYLRQIPQIHPASRCSNGLEPVILNLSIRAVNNRRFNATF